MKPKIYPILFLFIFLILPINFLFANASMQVIYPSSKMLNYNRFLVADLGLLGSGKSNKIFEVSFETDNTITDEYYLHIRVVDNSNNSVLLDGNTDSWPYNKKFSGKKYSNYNITEAASLGGKFTISDESKTLQDKILATGALPQGSFTIEFELVRSTDNVTVDNESIMVNITPPYIQPIFPVNTSVTPSGLIFRWHSNLTNTKLHIFSDPAGKREVKSGGRLPANVSGGRFNGVSIAGLLTYDKMYYWQVSGYINTSHGLEFMKGPITAFILKQEGSGVRYFGLSEGEKDRIKSELIKLLKTKVDKRAARSIKNYRLNQVVLDNGELSMNEILNILKLLEKGDLKIKSVYLR